MENDKGEQKQQDENKNKEKQGKEWDKFKENRIFTYIQTSIFFFAFVLIQFYNSMFILFDNKQMISLSDIYSLNIWLENWCVKNNRPAGHLSNSVVFKLSLKTEPDGQLIICTTRLSFF